MTSPYAQRALDLEVAAVAAEPEGSRNDRLNTAAFNLGQLTPLYLNEDVVTHALYDAAIAAGLDHRETVATIYSGLSKGALHPREPSRLNGISPSRPIDIVTVDTELSTPPPAPKTPPAYKITLTPASTITPRMVRWLWDGRIALGTLALIGGREGIGKSTVAYTLAAEITRGTLIGQYHGQTRAVIVAATEDSWEHTIVPRLMAAGADLDLVYRVDVVSTEGVDVTLSLPRDLTVLEVVVKQVAAAMILLDPLLSRLDVKLDTHKDAEVRIALEPLVTLAERTGCSVLGLIHVNKSTSNDPLTLLMGSRAFAAVARSVLFAMVDPEMETRRLLGQPKNNLGQIDTLPTLMFQIESAVVAETDEGVISTGHLVWLGESAYSITDALDQAEDQDPGATGEAADWLSDYLNEHGGRAPSVEIKRAGTGAGHAERTIQRARKRLRLRVHSYGKPRRTDWGFREAIPEFEDQQGSPKSLISVVPIPGETWHIGTTGTTGQTGQGEGEGMSDSGNAASRASRAAVPGPRAGGTTERQRCSVCRFPMDPALTEAGYDTHLGC
jgi:hypothetical protein